MLESFKRLFAAKPDEPDYTEVGNWAQQRGYTLKRVRGESGFVIDGALDDKPWRLEWGSPQRDYIVGRELRLRMELELPSDAQMLLLSRQLMNTLERKTFEEFTDNVQTQVGTKTPEEMRWLVMFPKVDLSGFKTLRHRFGAVASLAEAGLAWLSGPLGHTLERAANNLLKNDPPFVLMTLRGRAYLRMQLATPDAQDIAAALMIYETAVKQALAIGGAVGGHAGAKSRGWDPSSQTTAWQTIQPDEAVDPRKPS